MKKTILFLIVAANLAFATTAIYAQIGEWSQMKDVSCFTGFKAQVKNKGYVKSVNKYEWAGRIINNYGVDVTFDMYLRIGKEEKTIGRFTLGTSESKKITVAQSDYWFTAATDWHLEVGNVCFPSLGTCTAGCFAECDSGRPNQTSCANEDTAKAPVKQTKPGNQVAVNTPQNNGSGGQLSSFASSSAVIKQKIVENLKANMPLMVPIRQIDGIMWGSTVTNVSVQTDGESVTIKYISGGGGGPFDGLRNVRSLTMTFDQMRSTLKVTTPPGEVQQGSTYLTTTNIRNMTSDGRWGSGDFEAHDKGQVNWGHFYYDLGANNSNYNALMSLLKKLNGAPEPKKEASSSLAAIKQKIVENLRANVLSGVLESYRTNGILFAHTQTNVSVQSDGGGVTLKFTWKIEGAWAGPENQWSQANQALTMTFDQMRSSLRVDPNADRPSETFVKTTNFRTLTSPGHLERRDFRDSYNNTLSDQVSESVGTFYYDLGANNSNFDELKRLLNQLGGAPASGPTQSTANNPAPQISTRPVVASSGNPAQDGVDLYAAKQYEKAIESFKAAIAKNPSDAPSNYNLGLSYSNLKRYNEAIAAFKQAIVIKPDADDAYGQLASALDGAKRFDEAITAANKAVQLVPTNSTHHRILGVAQFDKGLYADAARSLEKAVELKPDDAYAHFMLGWAYCHLKDKASATKEYDILLPLNAKNAKALLGLINGITP